MISICSCADETGLINRETRQHLLLPLTVRIHHLIRYAKLQCSKDTFSDRIFRMRSISQKFLHASHNAFHHFLLHIIGSKRRALLPLVRTKMPAGPIGIQPSQVSGKTYILSNQWGSQTLEAIDSLKKAFPQLNIQVSPIQQG